ncbi:RelA/SpoT domain-containing protein [Fusobacterium sp.]|uniref:RelA/SpoT domain-containing protein n=1 Tax=Fusobacterium sp. TaxID=68766 RepID=UPI002625FF55|nr:RelA/SpoT domain-containing protein [Fusobacterium sp.]
MLEISKKQLKKLGDKIRNDEATLEDFNIISELRSNYSPLTRVFRDSLKNFKQVKEMKDSDFIISRRIKRMPSIIKKLKRFPNMNLDRIQDLGGVRLVLSTLNQVNTMADRLKNSTYRQKGKNNFLFIREKNYILEPKSDGYRSIHQVYRYQGNRFPNLKGLDIELQIRTKKQHQWATAVEILDMVLNSSLKTGIAEDHYKLFFRLCSCAIAHIENNYKFPNGYDEFSGINEVVEKILKLNEEYNIFNKLLSVSVITNNLNKLSKEPFKNDYLLLELNIPERKVSVRQYETKEEIELLYSSLENKYRNTHDKDVVMVSVEGMKNIRKAYPNYFLDAKDFVRTIESLIKKVINDAAKI